MDKPLTGKIALVAGATRGGGRGIAVALGEAGATVYATGRTTREQRSEIDRPETIEETAELVTEAGGEGIAVAVDHLDPGRVAGLMERIDSEHGRLDVLVNDIWGAEHLFTFNTPLWEHDLDNGLRLLRLAIDTHLITSHHALPLLIRRPGGLVVEVTDGTAAYNADNYRVNAFSIRLPSLRERASDIPVLAQRFLARYCAANGLPLDGKSFAKEGVDLLMQYHWPGNIRELESTVARAALSSPGRVIRPVDIEFLHASETPLDASRERLPTLAEAERSHIIRVLESVNWNKKQAASVLEISRGTLYRKIVEYGLEATPTTVKGRPK